MAGTIRNSLVGNVCDANQRGLRFGAATGLETSHNFAFNNTLTHSTSKRLDAQSVATENDCGQQYAASNTTDIGGVTGAVFFTSPSSAATAPATMLAIAASSPGTSAIPATTVVLTFPKPVTGLTLSDLSLTRGGVVVSLAGASLTTTAGRQFTLGSLGGLTAPTVGWIDDGVGSLTWAFAAPGDTNLDGMEDALDAADLIGGGLYDGGFYLPVASSGDRHSPRS